MQSSPQDDQKHKLTWDQIIERGLGECAANEADQPEKHCTMHSHPQTYIFWRIIRCMIRDPSLRIDEKLIESQIKKYSTWLNQKWFEKARHHRRFMDHLTLTLETECLLLDDVKQMLAIMAVSQFNDTFVRLVTRSQIIKHALTDAIFAAKNSNLRTEAVVDLFKQYGYPLEQQLFKIRSKTEQELEKVKMTKVFLKDAIQQKEERIHDLESQNDRLLKELHYLQELNQKNDAVKALEERNSKLLQQLHSLAEEKMKLAVQGNNDIDELRMRLIDFQNTYINN